MNREILLSIIVPVYNVEMYVEACIHSIERIKTAKEVICIDDGSTDHSLLRLKALAEQYNDIVIVEQDNSGVSKARNKGISLAKGKYICFFDSDDMVVGETVDHAVRLLEDEKVDCVSFGYQTVDEDCRYQDCEINQSVSVSYNLSYLYAKSYLWHMIMRREIFETQAITFGNMRYFEDKCLSMHFCAYCTKAIITTEVGYLYRMRSSSAMHSKSRHKAWFEDALKAAMFMELLMEKTTDEEYKKQCQKQKQLFILHAMTTGIMVPEYSAEWIINELKKNGLFPFAPIWRLLRPNGSSTALNYLRFGFFSKMYYSLFFKIVRMLRKIK